MKQALTTIAALLFAAALLLSGNGLQTSLLAVRGNIEGFPLTVIGLLLSSYFVGFIIGCRYTPRLVKRAGHIRSFTALASLASASALAHALAVEPTVWMLLRAVTGFCFAGLAMIIESWINERADNTNRGRILSVYRMVDLGALTLGNMLLAVASPQGFALFACISILISLSLVPVALTRSVAPAPITNARLDLRKLLRISPLGAVSVFTMGAANSAFWAVGPVFVLESGYSLRVAAAFMSITIVGGAMAQYPVGYLSDRLDRRTMILVFSGLSAASGLFIALTTHISSTWLFAGGFLFGFFALSIFSLGVAHSNDRTQPDEYLETNGGLLLLFGVGSVVGPLAGSGLMEWFGSFSLFIYTASANLALLAYGLYRVTRRAGVAEEDRDDFIVSPRTTPEVFALHPHPPDEPDYDDRLHD